jgi:hypothetical protein
MAVDAQQGYIAGGEPLEKTMEQIQGHKEEQIFEKRREHTSCGWACKIVLGI